MQSHTYVEIKNKSVTKIAKPRKYKVLMHNDDYTSMDFVIDVLISIFRKDEGTAILLMQQIHNEGLAICGIYTKEIAETKIIQVKELARANKYPLKCTMEEE